MPELSATTVTRVCDQCGGVIPPGASCYTAVSATVVIGGRETQLSGFTFCCTLHAMQRLQSTLFPIAAPNPPYPPYATAQPISGTSGAVADASADVEVSAA